MIAIVILALKIDFCNAVLVPEVKIPLASSAFKCLFMIAFSTVKRIDVMMEVNTIYTQANILREFGSTSIRCQQFDKVERAMMSKTVQ